MNIKKIIFLSFLLPYAYAHSNDGKWVEGSGQGNLEYFIEAKKHRLYLACPTENGSADSPSSVSFSINGNDINSFEITINGKKYTGPFDTDSRVGANNFIELLEDLKKSDAVINFKGGTITFPRSNANAVIPSYGKKGFSCNLDGGSSGLAQKPEKSTQAKINRPEYPSAYGKCYGALVGQMKLTGGKLSSQKAVNFYNEWTPYSNNLTEQVKQRGGCKGEMSNAELLSCYNKIFSDKRDAQFKYMGNLGFEEIVKKPASASNLAVAEICRSLVMETQGTQSSTSGSGTKSLTTNPTVGTVTRIDTSTGNIFITGISPWVSTNKGTSITVNGSRVKDEGDLMPGDKCFIRKEPTDLYARNVICTR